ncbi:hypothetical protein ALC56_09299 [Trachymyrmex septentrionalis]|uniref:Uncharacterized protein n=1 Tax=Trachymyrmex septentrionalis TaxID=34720 RepID=A0A195F8F4_9HYME|nr:hypothetical protein ALC56_09299 [Trachymyrmex septentrionalis]
MVYRTIVVDALEDDERRQDRRERLLPSPFPLIPPPSPLPSSPPRTPVAYHVCIPAARTLPRPQIEAPEKKRCAASPRILTAPPALPFPFPFFLLLFLSYSSEVKGKEEEEEEKEEEEENGESRWGNVRGEIAGRTTRLSWHKEERGRGKRRRWKRLKAKAPCWWR